MYHVTKIVVVALEKGKELTNEQRRIFYRAGYYVEEISYYASKQLKISDKERIRNANLIVILYKNKISGFGQKIVKYSALFDKKIIVKQNIELTDL